MKNIEKITEEAAELEYPNTDDSQRVIDLQYSFINGADWERNRNKWISVEDELPPLSHYFDSLSQSVMTCDNHCILFQFHSGTIKRKHGIFGTFKS